MATQPEPLEDAWLRSIADHLSTLAEQIRHTGTATDNFTNLQAKNSAKPSREEFLAIAVQRYQERRRRTALLGDPSLFGEPAWDILLDLYIAYAKGLPVSVSSACIGSAVPSTTGLRWLGILQEEGLIVREHDPRDQRRILVRLSNDGVQRMERFLREIHAGANTGSRGPLPQPVGPRNQVNTAG